LSIVVENHGTGTLVVDSISSDEPSFTPGLAALSVGPGGKRELPITFAPRAPGIVTGRLTLRSNDPSAPLSTIDLIGKAGPPPPPAGAGPPPPFGGTAQPTDHAPHRGADPRELHRRHPAGRGGLVPLRALRFEPPAERQPGAGLLSRHRPDDGAGVRPGGVGQ